MKLLLTCSNFKYSADYPLRIIKTVILFFQCTVDFNILLTQCPLLTNLQKLMSSSARNSWYKRWRLLSLWRRDPTKLKNYRVTYQFTKTHCYKIHETSEHRKLISTLNRFNHSQLNLNLYNNISRKNSNGNEIWKVIHWKKNLNISLR